jgi:hypothetical protein
MTMKQIEAKYNVNVIRTRSSRHNCNKYAAFLGGNSTGEPVVEVAEAYTLVTLAVRTERYFAKKAGK